MRTHLLALMLVAGVCQAGDEGWEALGERDGITIERRSGGEAFVRELRLTTHSSVPPAGLMATIWRHDEYVQFLPYLKRLDVLRDEGEEKLIYEQIRVPIVKDRDLTVQVTRSFAPEAGSYEVVALAVPDAGPRETREHVRVRTSLARWRLVPATDGGTAVTYTIRTDAGGRLPVWIFDVAQKDAAVKILRAMLERARQKASFTDRRPDEK
jgi:hypothetical protein